MNKYMLYTAALMAAGIMTSCEDDDLTGYSDLEKGSPVVSATIPEVAEGGNTALTITLSEAQIADIKFDIAVAEASTAIEGVDFDLATHSVEFDAGQTEVVVPIETYSDCWVEEGETIVLTLGNENIPNVGGLPATVTGTITNVASPETVAMYFSWMADGASNGVDFADIDIEVYSQNALEANPNEPGEAIVATAYTGGYESIQMDVADLEEGDVYLVEGYLYGAVEGEDGPISFPVTSLVGRCGSFANAFEQSAEFILTSDDVGTATYLGAFEKVGDEIVFYNDTDGEVVRGIMPNATNRSYTK